MNSQEAPQYITIDDVQYSLDSFSPQARQALSLFEASRQRMQNAQIELAMHQAAMNHFGAELRAQLQQMKPAPPFVSDVSTVRSPKAPARRPANQNSIPGKKKR